MDICIRSSIFFVRNQINLPLRGNQTMGLLIGFYCISDQAGTMPFFCRFQSTPDVYPSLLHPKQSNDLGPVQLIGSLDNRWNQIFYNRYRLPLAEVSEMMELDNVIRERKCTVRLIESYRNHYNDSTLTVAAMLLRKISGVVLNGIWLNSSSV